MGLQGFQDRKNGTFRHFFPYKRHLSAPLEIIEKSMIFPYFPGWVLSGRIPLWQNPPSILQSIDLDAIRPPILKSNNRRYYIISKKKYNQINQHLLHHDITKPEMFRVVLQFPLSPISLYLCNNLLSDPVPVLQNVQANRDAIYLKVPADIF